MRQCGFPQEDVAYISTPAKLSLAGSAADPKQADPAYEPVIQMAAGDRHSLALTGATFQVFGWGNNSHGQLGLSSCETELVIAQPQELRFFRNKIVVGVSAGRNHSGASTVEGYPYVWGSNTHGQLGSLSSSSKQRIFRLPQVVDPLLGNGIA